MWTSESNSDNAFSSFASSLGSVESSGSWEKDYENTCQTSKIDACPFFKIADTPSGGSVKLLNTAVDLASWRAMLVAVAMKGSTVVEVVCHHVSLTAQHLLDLSKALKSVEGVRSLKLDYIVFEGSEEESLEKSLLTLIAEATNIRFLSLMGNQLNSSFLAALSETLKALPLLEGVALSENNISDVGILEFFKVLPYCISLKKVCIRKNPLQGQSLATSIKELMFGQDLENGEALMKSIQKAIAEKNKSIQSANKARKKANLEEWPEIPAPANRIVSSGDSTRFLNHSISLLDFSYCSFEADPVLELISYVAENHVNMPEKPEGSPVLVIKIGGIDEKTRSFLSDKSFGDKISIQE